MKFKSLKLVPSFICGAVIALVCLFQALPQWAPSLDIFQRVEWMTYDWRVRQGYARSTSEPTPLGAVFIDDESLAFLKLPWPWPRQLYGKLVKQLTAQGAKATGFDILFSELHERNPTTDVKLSDGTLVGADQYFAQQLRNSSNVVLAVFGETFSNQWRAIPPANLFRTNAWAVGHATSDKDPDGVLRRARAYQDDPKLGRIWHLGIVLAARELNLDLSKAVFEPGRIILRGVGGVKRIIPVDRDGFFYINWSLAWNDPRITKGAFEQVAGLKPTDGEPPDWRGKLVVVGSIGAGNNISDLGSTPLGKESYLVSKHWNVAYSVITGRFVRTTSYVVELLLIVVLGVISAALTWNLRPPWPSLWVVAIGALYVGVALWLYVRFRYWAPIVLPVFGALFLNHVSLVTYQVLFEQREKRRVKSVFAKVVSPNVVNELLQAERIHLGGSRRQITVLFADVRGFTELTDSTQAKAEDYVREHQLAGEAAEAYFNEQAQITLDTVNAYLSTVADQIKKHDGTLDKYIGDCVMAFWGAPTPNEKHALCCVQAAIDAQRAIFELNQKRATENKQREQENAARAAAGQLPLPLLALLTLGTGINTGVAIVGLMGSDAHILNYTVFGREVNVASRLEGVSGRSRIIIGEATYLHLQRDDPAFAASCVVLPSVTVKGIHAAVKIFEVPWKVAKLPVSDLSLLQSDTTTIIRKALP